MIDALDEMIELVLATRGCYPDYFAMTRDQHNELARELGVSGTRVLRYRGVRIDIVKE